ncbi:MAG: type II toxin-antitoxin system HicB family antitoxin [Opitutaceae bacterium]|nr:type II toxin-antitoxin system HicB family antitoxin [Opitutaceae bacterium]
MKITRQQIEKAAKRYVKVVEWSETDRAYIGSAPPLVGQSCHGTTEAEVLAQLQVVVEEWVGNLLSDKKPLPQATANRVFSGKFVVRVAPEVHRKVALQAMAQGSSLNQFVAETLADA